MKKHFLYMICLLWLSTADAQQADTLAPHVSVAQKNATTFIQQPGALRSHFFALMAEYMQRGYGWQTSLRVTDILHSAPVYDDERGQMALFARLYNGKSSVPCHDIKAQTGLQQLMAWSINASTCKPDKTFSDMLWQYSRSGGRDLTHAALCLAWLQEQSMTTAVENADSLQRYQISSLTSLAQAEGYNTDTGLEALIGLIRLGRSRDIQPEWIAAVLQAQHADGGWPRTTEANESSDMHATLLALWVLLDYSHEGHAARPWIVK